MKALTFYLTLFCFHSIAQNAYRSGDVVADLSVKQLLNYNETALNLTKLKGNITIIDFFGTWCAPCLKALPDLQSYQAKFKEDIQVILVSTEAKTKLEKFIADRTPFSFPVIVDEDNVFTHAFKPPAYPYTILLDKNFKIVLIANAATDLSETILEKLIAEGRNLSEIKAILPEIKTEMVTEIKTKNRESSNTFVNLSQDFMYAAKTNSAVDDYISQLKYLDYSALRSALESDDDKKAFWINLYNAYTNASLHKDPDQYKSRNKFFKNKNIIVAGKTFSLDKIEHGLLRRSKIKWSLGYFCKLFPGKIEKNLRVDKLDYRIHFALNCGAKSCPPIAFYSPDKIALQLGIAEKAYLISEAGYNSETNILKLPAILSWFRRDFGGKKKMIELLKSKQLLNKDVNPTIKFKKYDWTLYLDNYKL